MIGRPVSFWEGLFSGLSLSLSLSSAIRCPYRGGASPNQQKKTHIQPELSIRSSSGINFQVSIYLNFYVCAVICPLDHACTFFNLWVLFVDKSSSNTQANLCPCRRLLKPQNQSNAAVPKAQKHFHSMTWNWLNRTRTKVCNYDRWIL